MVKKEKGIIDMFVDKIKKTSIVVVEDYIREKISKKIVNFLGKHTAYLIGFILIVMGVVLSLGKYFEALSVWP